MLRLNGVSLQATVGSAQLLDNISVQINNGDRIAIIGPSGAGKSSLFRLINRLTSPSEGSIYFEQQSITEIPVLQLRQRIALVPQESKLLGMTVQDAIAYPLVLQKLSTSEISSRVTTWRSALKIPDQWLERNELQLSGGQKQLVAIARALVMQPNLLLLDEPTSALDFGTANHLLEILEQISSAGHTTIMIISHQLELIKSFANRILYLESGKLTEDVVANAVNWQKLQEKLLIAETQSTQEWS
ncbi:Phosphonate-transporting ATPase [Stanieria cyanosphaera PCC 7437]|uniref:Phosphonate-transporting ATPase n=1 Tax=Stanieria cyanosphaera (strain ATCC 29371 / PCC 7437) TaxID=111780 RepID=K9XNM3_STAC7|nr:ATP-binding cassette domain-containing protein [Stanieria cyanosphaera]AFZ33636.1 Phosphonate-transporting ATPase [Stanieria cyanosphaera PCC 7437]